MGNTPHTPRTITDLQRSTEAARRNIRAAFQQARTTEHIDAVRRQRDTVARALARVYTALGIEPTDPNAQTAALDRIRELREQASNRPVMPLWDSNRGDLGWRPTRGERVVVRDDVPVFRGRPGTVQTVNARHLVVRLDDGCVIPLHHTQLRREHT